MQVKKTKDEELNKHFEVTIPSKDIDQKVDLKLKDYGRNIHLKGFRPGKAPLKVLRQHYGQRVMGEILEQAVNESTQKLFEDHDIKPAAQPKIEVVKFNEGEDLVYSVEVEQVPKFDLKDVSKLKVEKPVADIRDEEVDQALENVAKHHKNYVPVEKARAAKEGDAVLIDFEGELADGTKYPGMEGSDFTLELGSGQFIPGFEEQLTGKKPGDDAEVRVTFPEQYQVGDLAGKEAVFKVKVKEIQKAEKMEIGEELAKKVGFDSLEILKESIRNKLQSEYENMSQMKVKRNILDQLDDQYDFDLPPGLVDAEYEAIVQQVERDQHEAHGHDHDHDHSHELSEDDKKELKEIAERRVKLGLVLAELGKENSIEVDQGEIQEAVMKEAQKYPGSEQQVIEYFSKTPQALEQIRAPLFEEKVIEHILDIADVKEIIVTPEELAREDDEEEKPSSAKKKSGAKKDGAKKSEAQKSSKGTSSKKAESTSKKSTPKSKSKNADKTKSSGAGKSGAKKKAASSKK